MLFQLHRLCKIQAAMNMIVNVSYVKITQGETQYCYLKILFYSSYKDGHLN